MALAALGLGLQSQHKPAPLGAALLNAAFILFWTVQLAFFASLKWFGMSIICTVMVMLAIGLVALSIGAVRDSLQTNGDQT
jgi:hypothetical protein